MVLFFPSQRIFFSGSTSCRSSQFHTAPQDSLPSLKNLSPSLCPWKLRWLFPESQTPPLGSSWQLGSGILRSQLSCQRPCTHSIKTCHPSTKTDKFLGKSVLPASPSQGAPDSTDTPQIPFFFSHIPAPIPQPQALSDIFNISTDNPSRFQLIQLFL